MEIVGYEVCEAGSPLALDNGQFTQQIRCATIEFYKKLTRRSYLYGIPRIHAADAGFSRGESHPQQQSMVRRTQSRLPQARYRTILSFNRTNGTYDAGN